MSVVISLILIFIATAIVLLAAMRPPRPHASSFELKRRAAEGDEVAAHELRRERHYNDIVSLQRVAVAALLIVFGLWASGQYGLWTGLLLALLLAIFHGSLGRLKPLARMADRLYHEREVDLLGLAERYRSYMWWLRGRTEGRSTSGIQSPEELAHLVTTSRVLGDDGEKRLILNALKFHDRQVAEIMTPRAKLKTVKKTEILGPLVLDDLHRSGHQSFPVINGDLEHIVGVLRLSDVTTLDTTRKHTSLVETAMRPRVQYVSHDQSLSEALQALLASHEHLLIVTDDDSQVVGLLTLSDIMRALFGN